MKRRTVFKYLAAATAAAWMLPSCISDPKKVSISLNRLRITPEEEDLVGDIADVIVPQTETPGARAVGAHLFTLVMVDDCMDKEGQEKYLAGMRSFEREVRSATGQSFSDASADKQSEILAAFEEKLDDASDEVKAFYRATRRYVIQGYTSSQYFLTEVKPYQLVPGPHYDGCAPVTSDKETIS
jgi:hypothetical protein